MYAPRHTLNLYQKPKAGNGFLDRFTVYNYKHRISAVGWFDTATCDIVPRNRAAPEQFLDQFLGNRVAIYVDNPAEPIWEGFINRLTFSLGNTVFTISLDEMMNRVTVKNTQFAATNGTNTAPDTSKSLASQAVYGIKEGTLDLGFFRTTGSTKAATIAATKLQQLAWPKQSIAPGSGTPGVVHLEILGFYHTIKWQDCYLTDTTTNSTLTSLITNLTYGVLNNLSNTVFFDKTDLSDIASNTVTMPVNELRGNTYWDRLVSIQEIGDTNSNYYVVGVSPTSFQTGLRRLYYRAANNVVEYTALTRDGLRVRDLNRRLIPPWLVKPDRAVRVTDWVIGGAIQGDDPRETFIWKVDYDANAQTVIYTGDDNKTAEAAFQLHQNTKRFGQRFGAPAYLGNAF